MINVSKFIPRQIHVPYIGAMYELLNRVAFFISVCNILLCTRLYYYNTGDSLLRDTFGSYAIFMIAAGVIGIVLAVIIWACIVPSHNKFLQEQAVIDGRSPTFDKLCEVEKRLIELEKRI